jgi:hypothetical protein
VNKHGRIQINMTFSNQGGTKLIGQNGGSYFFNSPNIQFVQLERSEGKANKSINLKAEMFKDTLDLTIFTFAQPESQPNIIALFTINYRFNRTIMHVINRDAFAKCVENGLRDFSVAPNTITTQPARVR